MDEEMQDKFTNCNLEAIRKTLSIVNIKIIQTDYSREWRIAKNWITGSRRIWVVSNLRDKETKQINKIIDW